MGWTSVDRYLFPPSLSKLCNPVNPANFWDTFLVCVYLFTFIGGQQWSLKKIPCQPKKYCKEPKKKNMYFSSHVFYHCVSVGSNIIKCRWLCFLLCGCDFNVLSTQLLFKRLNGRTRLWALFLLQCKQEEGVGYRQLWISLHLIFCLLNYQLSCSAECFLGLQDSVVQQKDMAVLELWTAVCAVGVELCPCSYTWRMSFAPLHKRSAFQSKLFLTCLVWKWCKQDFQESFHFFTHSKHFYVLCVIFFYDGKTIIL